MKKLFAIIIKNAFGCCYIYIQTVKLEFTRGFSFVNFLHWCVNWSVLVCGFLRLLAWPGINIISFRSVYDLFIHCTAAELTGIFSDIMNKDCIGSQILCYFHNK